MTFRWKDYRDKGHTRHKTMPLEPPQFMRRFLRHVLPGGFHRFRHYGLLAIALVAVLSGFAMSLRFGRIGADLAPGKTYIACTALACVTSLGIFMHGGFNVAHSLALMTLVVLGVAVAAGRHRDKSARRRMSRRWVFPTSMATALQDDLQAEAMTSLRQLHASIDDGSAVPELVAA